MNTKRMRSRYYRSGNNGNGRHQGGQVSFNRNHVFESSGPNGRIRGTAQQLYEKYLQQGRDSLGSGDRITAESFFQYAEHYSRILNTINQSMQQRHRPAANQETANAVSSETIDKPEESAVQEPVENMAEEMVAETAPIKVEDGGKESKPVPARVPRRGRPPRVIAEKKKKSEDED